MTTALDFRPATVDLVARPGTDLAWRVTLRDGDGNLVPLAGATIDVAIGVIPVGQSVPGPGVIDLTLTDTQTTELGVKTWPWSLSVTAAGITTDYITGRYVGSMSGNTSSGLEVTITGAASGVDVVVQGGSVAAHEADPTGAHAATAVSFTPAAGIAATDVQGAIVEAVGDAATALSAHMIDPTAAHAASAVSFTPAGTVAATDAQTAIAEVATDAATALAGHTAATAGAHAATAVAFTPTGTVAATTVQAAVAEVATDAAAALSAALVAHVAAADPHTQYQQELVGFTPALGLDVTGATDQTTQVLAIIAACQAAGGGTIYWPAGIIRADGQLLCPNDAASLPKQKAMRWVGSGAWATGRTSGSSPNGGTIFDLRYNGSDACILTLGEGLLEITGCTFTQLGTAHTTPFIKTTNTVIEVHGCGFFGHASKTAATANQDAIILGGTTTNLDGSTSSAFQGYGTSIHHNTFNKVKRLVYGRTFCNNVFVHHNTAWAQCGGGAGSAAFEFDAGIVNNYVIGNVIEANLVEMVGYEYMAILKYAVANTIINNGCFDPGASVTAGVKFDTHADFNYYQVGYWATSTGDPSYVETGSPAGAGNTIVDTAASQTSRWRQFTSFENDVFFNPGTTGFGSTTFQGGQSKTIIQPKVAQASDGVKLLTFLRSAAEGTNPSQEILSITQGGDINIANTAVKITTAGRGWIAQGAGGAMTIDSGSGGSNVDVKGFRLRFIDHAGTRQIALANSLPTDGSLANGEVALYFDSTNGASKLKIKGKSANGTVVTGEIALA